MCSKSIRSVICGQLSTIQVTGNAEYHGVLYNGISQQVFVFSVVFTRPEKFMIQYQATIINDVNDCKT